MTDGELIKQGNTFVFRYLLVVLFVYFIVIAPLFNRDQTLDARIQRGEEHILAIERRLDDLIQTMQDADYAPARNTPGMSIVPQPSSVDLLPDAGNRLVTEYGKRRVKRQWPAPSALSSEQAVEKEIRLRQELVKAESDYINLEKSKPKREFAVPFVPGAIPEGLILTLFPAIAIGGFWRILKFRRDVLRLQTVMPSVPVWITPLPYEWCNVSFWKWVLINLVGFAAVGSIAVLVCVFLLWYSASKPLYFLLCSSALIVTLFWYLQLIVQAAFFRRSRWRESTP